jgi:low temperature requirement protein LtrA
VRRRQTDGASQGASTLELFYDLVFVFAITQVSHLLLEHLTWAGVLQSLIVLLAVYWS